MLKSPHRVVLALLATAVVAAATPADAQSRKRSSAAVATYTVKRGDTLGKIADRLGVSLAELKSANGLRSNTINPGQKLKNPKAVRAASKASSSRSARAAPTGASATYRVRRGDTLYSIARKFGTTEAELRAANNISRRAVLRAGQTLKVGGQAEADQPVETAGSDDVLDRLDRSMAADRGAAGRIVDVSGPARTYRVRKGDTLSEAADRLGLSVAEAARINKLKKPYRLRPGQTIRGRSTTAKAYVVASGDTLSGIAQRFGVTEAQLRSANGLRRGASLSPGRKVRLPAGFRDRGPVEYAAREPGGNLPSTPQPYVPPRVAPRTYTPPPVTPGGSGGLFGAPTPTPTPSDTQLSQMGRGVFIWPLTGQVLSTFGPKAGGVGNDGLNIRANSGDSVRAAAAGDVIYAGDQVPGYGNLVLIRHADGWVTAYGHLARVDVRMQQKVIQGQQIGQAGQTGGVSEPQLHFEVRYQPNNQERAKPIDPSLVLPRG